jgi:hypothetical protein
MTQRITIASKNGPKLYGSQKDEIRDIVSINSVIHTIVCILDFNLMQKSSDTATHNFTSSLMYIAALYKILSIKTS